MPLTPDQKKQIQEAKEAGATRTTLEFTAEQASQWSAEVAQEQTSKDENIQRHRKVEAAAREPGFLGDVRRAVLSSRRPFAELAADSGVEVQRLSDFLTAEAELPSTTLAQLVNALGLRLMHEIPPARTSSPSH